MNTRRFWHWRDSIADFGINRNSTVESAVSNFRHCSRFVDVLKSDAVREGIKQISDWPTVPQLFVGGEFVGGCDIVLEMHASGELKTLLDKVREAEEDGESSKED